jgi:hypothetical protein
MNLSDVLEKGEVTMRRENNKFTITFAGKYDYGIFTSETFEGKTLKEAYEKLVRSDRLKSIK